MEDGVRGIGSGGIWGEGWGAVNTSPVLGVDSKVVWEKEVSVQLFLVFGIPSKGTWLADRNGKYVRVDERKLVVVNSNVPELVRPLVRVVLAVREDELFPFWVV